MIDSRRCSFAVDGIQHNHYQTYQVSHIERKTHAFEIELTLSRVQSTLHLFSTVKTGMVVSFSFVYITRFLLKCLAIADMSVLQCVMLDRWPLTLAWPWSGWPVSPWSHPHIEGHTSYTWLNKQCWRSCRRHEIHLVNLSRCVSGELIRDPQYRTSFTPRCPSRVVAWWLRWSRC